MSLHVSVLGCGNLASALTEGWLKSADAAQWSFRGTVKHAASAEKLEKRLPMPISVGGNREASAGAELVVLGVKPYSVKDLVHEIGDILRPEQIVISLAAAVPLSALQSMLPPAKVPPHSPATQLQATRRGTLSAPCSEVLALSSKWTNRILMRPPP
jgi:pyrroline-5-carboxylate reductase